jgi:3-carboxy-cis,cis-muconate cycloisomerase
VTGPSGAPGRSGTAGASEAGGIHADAGLLSPVRAGTPVEAAVCDLAWLQAMLDAEAALARAQARLGLVPEPAARAITRAARAERFDLRALAVGAREAANPVVGLVQALMGVVGQDDPAAAEHVHRGSTSQDILDTGAMLVAARALRLIRADLATATAALAGLAREHRDTPMAGRTLALHAVPTTFGLKAAGWRRLLLDADRRLEHVLAQGLPVSLGGAAGTLSGYLEHARVAGYFGNGTRDQAVDSARADAGRYVDALVEAFAAETGLARPDLPWHALRTPLADIAAALAFTAGALGKIAVDVQSLARTEVGEVAEPSAPGRGASSAMPHKQNPVLATLIRSAAVQVPAMAAGLTQCMVAEDERAAGAWHAEWHLLRECLRLTGGAAHTAAELAGGLVVKPQRMNDNLRLGGSQVVSERIAAVLAPLLGKAAAKRLLSQASRQAAELRVALREVLASAPELEGKLDERELVRLCEPADYTGAAAALVDRALA